MLEPRKVKKRGVNGPLKIHRWRGWKIISLTPYAYLEI